MFLLIIYLCFYNPHAGKIFIKKNNTKKYNKKINENDEEMDIIEVDCDIANATRAGQIGYIISIPNGKSYWTSSIAADYICGSGDSYVYSSDIDGVGILIVCIISLLVSIIICATWPVLALISTDLHSMEERIITVIKSINDIESENSEDKKKKMSNRKKDLFIYIWLLIAAVILLFVSVLVAQLLCSMMNWRNIYKKKIVSNCYFIDKSKIESYKDVKRIKDDNEVEGMGMSVAAMNYDKEKDTATFIMEHDRSIWKSETGVEYEFTPPSSSNIRVGEDRCEKIRTYILKGVYINNKQPKNGVFNSLNCDNNIIATPSINTGKCKRFSGNLIFSDFHKQLSHHLIFSTGETNNIYSDNSTQFLRLINENNNGFNDKKNGWCTLKGCMTNEIYVDFNNITTWSYCKRAKEQQAKNGSAFRLFNKIYTNLPHENFKFSNEPVKLSDEYYKGFSGKISYKIFKNYEYDYDYIDGRLFVHNKNDKNILSLFNLNIEAQNILKKTAMKSIMITENGLVSSYVQPKVKSGCEEIGCWSTVEPLREPGSIIYTLSNASRFEEFREPCNEVKAYNDNGRVFIGTEQNNICNVIVRYDSGTRYSTVAIKKGAPSDITGAESWHCKTDSSDLSIGLLCKGKNSVIGLGVIAPPEGDKERKEGSDDLSFDSSNLGEANNKSSVLSIAAIIGIVVGVLVVIIIVVIIVVKIVIPRIKKKKERDNNSSEYSA